MTSATYAPQTSWPGNQRNSTSIPSAAYLSQTFQSGSETESVSAPWHGSAGGAEIRADQTQGVPASTREADTDADAPHDTDADAAHDTDADDAFVASLVQLPEESVPDDHHNTTPPSSQNQDTTSTAPLTQRIIYLYFQTLSREDFVTAFGYSKRQLSSVRIHHGVQYLTSSGGHCSLRNSIQERSKEKTAN
jgi:hypothetical protein